MRKSSQVNTFDTRWPWVFIVTNAHQVFQHSANHDVTEINFVASDNGSLTQVSSTYSVPVFVNTSGLTIFSLAPASAAPTNVGTYNGLALFSASGTTADADGLSATLSFSYVGTGSTTYPASTTAPTNVGTYAVTATRIANDTNHTASSPSSAVAFTINKAHLTVTANAARFYGAPNPSFAATFSGFANNETLAASGISGSASFTSNDTLSSPVGSYIITPTIGSLTASNYDFTTFNTGVLTVNKAHLTVTANAASRLYGAADPSYSATISGFANNQTLATSGVNGSASLTSNDTLSSPVGAYIIMPTIGSLTGSNYDFTPFTTGTLTVNAVTTANLQATLGNQSSIVLQVFGATEATTDISAINALTAPPSPVTITLNMTSGAYIDLQASPPPNVTLIISGADGIVTIVGHSPALTVTTGTVIIEQMTLSTPTDSPTILVTGGSLTLRDDTVQKPTVGNQPALLITGGAVDLDGSDILGNVIVGSGAKLGGTGAVTGSVTAQNGGTVAPGMSPGILNTGDVIFNLGSIFDVEIGGTLPGNLVTNHDQLKVTGMVKSLRSSTMMVLIPSSAHSTGCQMARRSTISSGAHSMPSFSMTAETETTS